MDVGIDQPRHEVATVELDAGQLGGRAMGLLAKSNDAALSHP
jgi:hypothetical protein